MIQSGALPAIESYPRVIITERAGTRMAWNQGVRNAIGRPTFRNIGGEEYFPFSVLGYIT